MKTLKELIQEKRWPDDPLPDSGLPLAWNRGEGLVDLCCDIFRRNDPDKYTIADIGVARGISTQIFAYYGSVLGVDHHLWDEAKALIGMPRITLMEEDTFAAAEFLMGRQQFDCVYLDSVHEEDFLTREIKAWLPLVKKGGTICGHDANSEFPGVMKAVAKTLGGWDLIYSDSSWMKRL